MFGQTSIYSISLDDQEVSLMFMHAHSWANIAQEWTPTPTMKTNHVTFDSYFYNTFLVDSVVMLEDSGLAAS